MTTRRHELDLMRALVVVGLIFFHSALVFSPTDDYYVRNGATSDVVSMVAGLAVVWAMPLLLLIAGTGVWYSLRSRTAMGFVRERLRRLFVPPLRHAGAVPDSAVVPVAVRGRSG